jgi:hypothetical protein
MAVVRRAKSVRFQGFAARPGTLLPWAAAGLSFVFLAPTGDEPLAYSAGCARCGAPATALPFPTLHPKTTFVERRRRQERWTLKCRCDAR